MLQHRTDHQRPSADTLHTHTHTHTHKHTHTHTHRLTHARSRVECVLLQKPRALWCSECARIIGSYMQHIHLCEVPVVTARSQQQKVPWHITRTRSVQHKPEWATGAAQYLTGIHYMCFTAWLCLVYTYQTSAWELTQIGPINLSDISSWVI